MSSTKNSIRCVIIGDGAVGKTSMLLQYVNDSFPTEHEATVYDDYSAQVTVDGVTYDVTFCDTAGQDDYDRLRPLSYPKTDIFIVAYDITSPISFENCRKKWISEKEKYMPGIPFVLTGNKLDLREDKAKLAALSEKGLAPVGKSDANKLVEETKRQGCVAHFECSALTQAGLKEVFDHAISVVLARRKTSAKKSSKCSIL
jgi:Ras-related C3 botulinum toxin substrate 1